jgi:hypothetical protein
MQMVENLREGLGVAQIFVKIPWGAQWAKNQKKLQKLKFSSKFNKLSFI